MATTTIYTVESTDAGIQLVIQPRTFNGPNGVLRNSDLTLYGNATPNWGEDFNQNFYRLTENFACEEKGASPGTPQDEGDLGDVGLGVTNPLQGQFWYNKTDDRPYVQTIPTADLGTTPANWEGISFKSEVDALSGSVGSLVTDKVDRAGDSNLTGVHSYPGLFFNEGNGDITVGADIRMVGDGLLASADALHLHIDGINNTVGGLVVAKGSYAQDGSEIELLRIHNNGLIEEQIDSTTYSGLVTAGTDKTIPNRKYVDDEVSSAVGAISLLPPGTVLPYAGASAPTNFVFANGATYDSIAQPQYAGLYAAIGVTYGGTGPSNFNVPNMAGRTPVGIGAGSFVTLGQMTGTETHSLSTAENATHTHAGSVSGSTDAESSHDHYTQGGGNPSSTGASGDNKNVRDQPGYTVAPTTPHSHTILGASVTIGSSGSGDPHNNIQPSFGVNYIISL